MMRAQLLINVVLLTGIILHLVHTEILQQNDQLLEDKSGTNLTNGLNPDLILGILNMSYLGNTSAPPTTTLPPEITTIYNNTIETSDDTEATTMLVTVTESTKIGDTSSTNTTTTTTQHTTSAPNTTTMSSTSTTTKTLSTIGTVSGYDKTTTTERYKPIKFLQLTTKKRKICKKKRKLNLIGPEPAEMADSIVEKLTPINKKLEHEEKYYGQDDPWRHDIFRCWIYHSCNNRW